MNVHIVWLLHAELELLRLPPSEADAILDTIEHFAATGEGFVRRMSDGSDEHRLYGRGHYSVVSRVGDVLYILHVMSSH
jgi:hypothetical protein